MRPAAQLALTTQPEGLHAARPDVASAAEGVNARIHDAAAAAKAMASEWTELAAVAAESNAFAEHWFVAASLLAFAAVGQVRLVAVRRGLDLIGLLPLEIGSRYGRTPVRLVRNWRHHNLFLGTPLVRAGEEEAFWGAILDTLDDADWAPGFFYQRGLAEGGPVHRGLVAAAAARGRACPVVHRETRALLEHGLDPDAYYRRGVRSKKRKELRRLRHRLGELGEVRLRRLDDADRLAAWCGDFLALERAGWKGRSGSALACSPDTEAFFREVLAGAWAAGRLQFLRLELGDRTIAMLVNFLCPPGAFAFKTAFDEAYARFSPGVLIQLENLDILSRPDIAWMDSCAAEAHPMIDRLWSGRRSVVQVAVRLKGLRRGFAYAACRGLEIGARTARRAVGGAK